MKYIDKTDKLNRKKYSLGDVFKFINDDDGSLADILMICQDNKFKYYFASLSDEVEAGKLYGWGNGNPADTIEDLFEQISDADYHIKPVNATITITEE